MFSFTQRQSRQVVLEFNPYQVLAAQVSQPQRGRLVIEATAEFARDNADGLEAWLENRPWTSAITGLVPRRGIVQRETLEPGRLAAPDYLSNAIEEQQKGQFLSATPFKVVNPAQWTLRSVDATAGGELSGTNPQPAVICGIANDELREVQHRLLEQRLIPERIESGLLSLFGQVIRHNERRGDQRATAIVVVHPLASAVYILGKEGVHTPAPVFHGFSSIIELARKELGVKEEAELRRMLFTPDLAVIQRADRLVRRIGRDLKPVLDSYEMTTGQPLHEVICPYLPPGLAWISDGLATATGRVPSTIDCETWMPSVGIYRAPDVGPLRMHWFGALSLMASLPPPQRLKSRATGDGIYARPWHVDYKLPAISAERLAANRRFLTGVVAVALLVFAAALTGWQIYANRSLRKDVEYWEQQIAANRQLFDELSTSNARLQKQSGTLKEAYDLMRTPFQLTDFMIRLGRTIPPRMRVDHIETSDRRAVVGGSLLEPAEEATDTLGLYMEDLRRNPDIGPYFSSIAITSLQRKSEGDAVVFEITLRLKDSPP